MNVTLSLVYETMTVYKTVGVIQRADWFTLPRFYVVSNQNCRDVTRRYSNQSWRVELSQQQQQRKVRDVSSTVWNL